MLFFYRSRKTRFLFYYFLLLLFTYQYSFAKSNSLTSFTWGPHYFTLAESLKTGDQYLIALRAINGTGYGQIFQAEIQFSGLLDFQRKLQGKFWGLKMAARIAREMSEQTDYWLGRISKITENVFQSEASKNGDQTAFLATFEDEYKMLTSPI